MESATAGRVGEHVELEVPLRVPIDGCGLSGYSDDLRRRLP